ncbi:MAG: hypothetical protein ABIA21_01380 [Candidatus Aenigmatarchaeota archaeon]
MIKPNDIWVHYENPDEMFEKIGYKEGRKNRKSVKLAKPETMFYYDTFFHDRKLKKFYSSIWFRDRVITKAKIGEASVIENISNELAANARRYAERLCVFTLYAGNNGVVMETRQDGTFMGDDKINLYIAGKHVPSSKSGSTSMGTRLLIMGYGEGINIEKERKTIRVLKSF